MTKIWDLDTLKGGKFCESRSEFQMGGKKKKLTNVVLLLVAILVYY